MKQRYRHFWITTFVVNILSYHMTLTSPVFVPQFLSEGVGRNIRHLPCVSRKTGETGICMFAYNCAKANGTHLGTCIDRFYFGSCCKIEDDLNILPQDNTIDVESSLSMPPNILTTVTSISESNDIPGNVDRHKYSTLKPTTSSVLEEKSTLGSATSKIVDQTKAKPLKTATKKPMIPDSTTESMKFSTFQTVQKTSEHNSQTHSSTTVVTPTKKIQKPNISEVQSTSTLRPSSHHSSSTVLQNKISSSTHSLISTSTPSYYSSFKSSLHPIMTTSMSNGHGTSEKQSSTTMVSNKPVSVFDIKTEPTSIGVTKISSIYTTTHRNSIDHTSTATTSKKPSDNIVKPTVNSNKISLVTRFPPRNATTETIFSTSNDIYRKNTTVTTTETNKNDGNLLTTNKLSTTKRPVKITTKKPVSSTVKKQPSTVPSTLATNSPITNFSAFDIVTDKSTTTSTNYSSSYDIGDNTINTTAGIYKKPVNTSPIKKTTIAPTKKPITSTVTRTTTPAATITTTTTKRPLFTVLKKNTTSSSSSPVTGTNPTKLTTFTRKPIISTTSMATKNNQSSYASSSKISTTTIKTTTVHQKITTKPITNPVITTKPASLLTTTMKTTAYFNASDQTTIKSVTQSDKPSSSVTSAANKINTTHSNWNLTASTTVTDDKTDRINVTTVMPGIVTWTSVSNKIENVTKTTIPSSTLSETTETAWNPITTPDGWIIIQSPTTEKIPVQVTEKKPITSSTSFLTTKPITESTSPTTTTTTQQSISSSQMTTYIDTLSTLATITTSPELTESTLPPLNMSNFREVCGRRLFPESRIVGGDGSTFGKWPWQISLRQWRTSAYLHKCGAALLNENWAITAAHCVQNVLPSDLLLRIGEHDLGNEEEPYNFQERRVQIVASHPNFDPRTFEFDLALMRFYEPVLPFQPNVLPICIPDDDEDYVGQTAYVTGWGRLYEDGPLPSVLQEVAVPVINNSVCEGMYRNAGYIEHIPHIFICAGWRKGGFDSCEGDSGGPLVIQRKRDKRWILAGVISWGIGCAEPNQPGVYTRISEFREWINQILQF